MTEYVEWDALANIVVVGLLLGAGLPALFAVGVRLLEGPGARHADGGQATWRVILAWACFATTAAAVIAAVALLASGGHA